MTDPIVDAVCADLQARSAVGIAKYGVTLEDAVNVHSLLYWLQHAYEETLDRANYLKAAIETIRCGRPMTTPDSEMMKIVNAEIANLLAISKGRMAPYESGAIDMLRHLKARSLNMDELEVCMYPHCNCPVEFPAGFKPTPISCPRGGSS